MSIKKVGLIYQNDGFRGPGKVVANLKQGLAELKIESARITADNIDQFDAYGILQSVEFNMIQMLYNNNIPALMGPNLFVTPNENPSLVSAFSNFVVPAEWVKKLYHTFSIFQQKKTFVWPVGIDTEKWKPATAKTEYDCFIYYKNRTSEDLKVVKSLCRKNNLRFTVLEYGNYKEEELKSLCDQMASNGGFAILLTNTESQGIAYMEMLSNNVPCYVIDYPYWKSDDGSLKVDATSVPYFNEKCGRIAKVGNLIADFGDFITTVETYSPREYMIENHTLAHAAQDYVDILKEINAK